MSGRQEHILPIFLYEINIPWTYRAIVLIFEVIKIYHKLACRSVYELVINFKLTNEKFSSHNLSYDILNSTS